MIALSNNYFADQLPNGRVDVYKQHGGKKVKVVHCLNVDEAIMWVSRAEFTPQKLAR